MTDKTDTEMTISKSYSRQAVNSLCETMITPVSKSSDAGYDTEEQRQCWLDPLMLARSSVQTQTK